MKGILIACILLTHVSRSFQFNIQPDLGLNGVVLQPFQKAHSQANSQFLSYNFNVSILRYINEHRDFIESVCPQKISILKHYDSSLKFKWNTPVQGENRGVSVSFFPNNLSKLNDKIKMLAMSNCDAVEDIIIEIYKLNDKLNEMANSNFASVSYFVPVEMIQDNIWYIIEQNREKSSIPLNKRAIIFEILRYATFRLYYKNDIISIELEIPFFKQQMSDLYTINVKPFIWGGNAYLFDTSDKYAMIDSNQILLYTEDEYQENCFKALEIVYCKTITQSKNNCFNKIIHNKFDKECLIRLKNQNLITQIGRELYFTVFSPFNIMINKNAVAHTLHINESSKIIENLKYNLSTPFFNFTSNGKERYEIFYQNRTNEVEMEKPLKDYRILILLSLISFCFLTRLIYYYYNKE